MPPVVYQDLSTLHDWPAKEPWPIYETHFCNWLSPLEPRARIPALVPFALLTEVEKNMSALQTMVDASSKLEVKLLFQVGILTSNGYHRF